MHECGELADQLIPIGRIEFEKRFEFLEGGRLVLETQLALYEKLARLEVGRTESEHGADFLGGFAPIASVVQGKSQPPVKFRAKGLMAITRRQ